MADLDRTILDNLDVLNSGVSQVTADGVSTAFDLEYLTRRQIMLKRRLRARFGEATRHRNFSQDMRLKGGCE
jgi:hypothetical protein